MAGHAGFIISLVKRLAVLLLLVVALPARMAWADVMPLKMAPWSVPASAAIEDGHAHCHEAIDEISSIGDIGDASAAPSSPSSGDKQCGECPACHGLAVVMPSTLQPASQVSPIRVATTPAALRSAESIALDKPPIS